MSAKNRRPAQHPVPQAQAQHPGQPLPEPRAQRLLQALQEQEARSQATLSRLELKERELDEKIREVNSVQSGLRKDIISGNETMLAFKVALQAFAKQEVQIILEAAVRDAIDDFDDEMNTKIEEQATHVVNQFDKLKMVLMGLVDRNGKVKPGAITLPDVVAGLFVEVEAVRRKGHL